MKRKQRINKLLHIVEGIDDEKIGLVSNLNDIDKKIRHKIRFGNNIGKQELADFIGKELVPLSQCNLQDEKVRNKISNLADEYLNNIAEWTFGENLFGILLFAESIVSFVFDIFFQGNIVKNSLHFVSFLAVVVIWLCVCCKAKKISERVKKQLDIFNWCSGSITVLFTIIYYTFDFAFHDFVFLKIIDLVAMIFFTILVAVYENTQYEDYLLYGCDRKTK